MSAKRFLELLTQAGLLDDALLGDLRKQVSEHKATAAAVAKHLVDKGHLTKFQATQFVGLATSPVDEEPLEVVAEDEEELGLAPFEDDPDLEARIRADASFAADARRQQTGEDVVLLEDAGDGLMPVEEVDDGLTPVGDAPTPAAEGDGLGDLLSDVDSLENFDDLEPPAPTTLARRPARGNVWESKLMIGGGLALSLLLILFVVLFVNLSKTPAVEMWGEAMEYYRSGSYTQAQVAFEEFLEDYPEDDNASEGRVRVALCKIRVVISDAAKGLERAQTLLPPIESEEAFTVARDELATLLIKIPEGFVGAAQRAEELTEKERLVALAEEGMSLVAKPSYVPSSRRAAIRGNIERVEEDINLVHRDINRDRDLAQAIEDIDTAAEEERTADAYQLYQALVKRYPILASDEDLIASVKRVAERQRSLVKMIAAELQPSNQDIGGPAPGVVLASTTGEAISQLEGQVFPVAANGAVYGVAADSGRVLWSRTIGHDDDVDYRVIGDDGTDLLLVDALDDALLRVGKSDGQLRWRLEIGEAFSSPRVAGSRVFVSTDSGRILDIDGETGESQRQAAIPQELSISPTAAPNRSLLFQIGAHSNLYMISTETMECEDVYYVGHKRGTIEVPPIVHLGHVFLLENVRDDYAELRILKIESGDGRAQLKEAQPAIRLPGKVNVPMLLYGGRIKRLLVVTELGGIEVFDVDVNRSLPVTQAAAQAPTLDDPLVMHSHTAGSTLWVASDRLTQYRIQVTTKTIRRDQITNVGDTFLSPPVSLGDYLIHVRRPKQETGIAVTAVLASQPRSPLWQTRIGGVATPVLVNEQRVHVVTAGASHFSLNDESFGSGLATPPVGSVVAPSRSYHFRQSISLTDGRTALFNPEENGELLLFDPAAAASKLKLLRLPLSSSGVTCLPVALGDRLILPLENGEVTLFGLGPRQVTHRMFRPQTEPGERVQWWRPAPIGDQSFVIADASRSVYRVEVAELPEPSLSIAASNELEVDITSQLAVTGETAFAAVRSPQKDALVALELESLTVRERHELEGARVTWGPERVGDAVLVVVDDKHLYCFDDAPRWESPGVAHGRPISSPLVIDDSFVFASAGGVIWQVSAATGEEIARREVSRSLQRGPLQFGEQLVLSASDGTVHLIPMPTAE